ncbi:MAG: serine hydrolase domain-containing protein [Gemmatimonadales bacterium]|jgi:CubicO group peptidase (beta-lactamase class C family)
MLLTALALAIQTGSANGIDAAVQRGIAEGVFPGAVVVVGTGSRILHARGYGRYAWSAESRVPDPDRSLFDLASLTKVVATTAAVMLLVQDGEIHLDSPVQDYLPEFVGIGKGEVTVRQLLEHRSGLRAFLPLNELATTAGEARRLVLDEPLRFAPGERVVYSDLNAMLLGWVVEAVSGTGLDDFVEGRVYPRLGMASTQFRPPASLREAIVPVGLWRGHVIAGELHDQNAARLGGVAGHAGLYSTGQDLARYAQSLLNAAAGAEGDFLFRQGVVRHFTRRGPGNRALGWEMRDTTSTDNAGSLMTPLAYGHTGYTGTSMWIDPERGLFVIVLTNRVFAPRTRNSITKLKRIRGEVADAAVRLWVAGRSSRDAATGPC